MKKIIIICVSLFIILFLIQHYLTSINSTKMKVAVWDTYVNKKDGSIMHFDILVPAEIRDSNIIYRFGLEYLKEKGFEGLELASKECKFCHVEVVKPAGEQSIQEKGYYIYEMENCN